MSMKIFEVKKIHKEQTSFLRKKTKKQQLFLTRPITPIKTKTIFEPISNSTDISINEQLPNEAFSIISDNNNNHNNHKESTSIYITHYTKEQLDSKYNIDDYLNRVNYESQLKRKDYVSVLPNISPRKRLILFDWIMEICNLKYFNRETYHLSVGLFDMYLSKINKLLLSDIQLIGVTCMFIAAKNEEYHIPRVEFFAQTTKFTYISRDILECETKILRTLNWKIQMLTLNFWSNLLISKWDEFNIQKQNVNLTFKHKPILYIHFFGIIDLISMDYYHLFKDPKIICGCVLYLLIGLSLKAFTIHDISLKFTKNECVEEHRLDFNMYVSNFLVKEYGISLDAFNECICYVSEFFVQELFDNAKERVVSINGRSVFVQDYSRVKMGIIEKLRS